MTDPAPLTCISCRYDLSGLDRSGVCPECGKPIAHSLPEAPRPMSRRLRALNVAYLTACVTLVVWSWIVNELQNIDWKYSWNRELEFRWHACWFWVWIVGIVLFLLNNHRNHGMRWVVLGLQLLIPVTLLTRIMRPHYH